MPAIRKSSETYKELNGKLELYQVILKGLNQIKNGDTITEEEMMRKIKKYTGV